MMYKHKYIFYLDLVLFLMFVILLILNDLAISKYTEVIIIIISLHEYLIINNTKIYVCM